MTEDEKRAAGMLFYAEDEALLAQKQKAHRLSKDYSDTYDTEAEKRAAILKELLGAMGDGVVMQGPIFFHYGIHTKIGSRVFANYAFTVQDDAEVTIGDDCDFDPNVTIVTPVHPLLPSERKAVLTEAGEARHLCFAKPVHIGSGCWFGAGVTVCPGVTIGDGCVIGAGSVVTRDIPPMRFAAGVPCRVVRTIGPDDSMLQKPERLGGAQPLK